MQTIESKNKNIPNSKEINLKAGDIISTKKRKRKVITENNNIL
jgi:hypothetical protein